LKGNINIGIIIISPKYELDKLLDANFLAQLLSLINYTEVINSTKKNEIKLKLFNELQTDNQNKKISNNSIIYLSKSFKFGNTMILLIKFRYDLANKRQYIYF